MEKLQQYAIRTVRPEDLDQVAQMELSCFPAAEAADRESLSQRIGTFPESFFVAEGEGKLLGMINGCATDSRMICDEMFSDPSFHQPDGAYQAIFGLDLLPAYRHRRITSGLIGHLIEDARKRGRKGLILTCKEGLIPFYEAFGYRNLGVSASVHGGAMWYDMVLEFAER